MTSEPLLDRSAHKLEEAVVASRVLFEVLLELRSKHVKKFSVPGDERECHIARAEYHGISRLPADHWAAKVPFERLLVRTRLHQLHSDWRDACTAPMTRNGEHPGEAMLDECLWLDLHRQRPAKLDYPLFGVLFVQDLLRSRQLL